MDETMGNLIEVQDSQVDIGSLVAHVQSNLEQRQKQADERGLDFTAISQGLPSLPADHVLSAATYYNLLKAEISQERVGVSPEYRPVSIPIVGRLWHKIRRQAHGLVMFYVNKAAARQMIFDHHMLMTLRTLIDDVEAHIKASKDGNPSGLSDFRERLTQLEQHIEGDA